MGPYGSIWLDTAAKLIVRTLRIFFVFQKDDPHISKPWTANYVAAGAVFL